MKTTRGTQIGIDARREAHWSLLSLRVGTKCFLALAASLLAVVLLMGSASAQEVITHRVAPGETLSSIARLYGVTTAQIQRVNNIPNPNMIRAGQVLLIPSSRIPPVAPPPTPPLPTLPIPAPPVRSVPASPPAPTAVPIPTATPNPNCVLIPSFCIRTHTVMPGDTLTSIALRYGVSVNAIKQRNNLRSDLILVDQRLIIP